MFEKVSPVAQSWSSLRGGFVAIALFSFVLNLLMLAGPLYMLQVYDRVLTSQNMDTLIALTVLLAGVLVVTGCLDFVRMRILSRLGARFELRVGKPILEAAMRRRVHGKSNEGATLVDDVNGFRDFISGNTLVALFDAPWIPVYLFVLFVLHPYLGMLGVAGALLLSVMAIINNLRSSRPMQRAADARRRSDSLFHSSERNAEVIHSMGMISDLSQRWTALQLQASGHKMRAGDRIASFSVMSKTLRMALQSGILGLGAALAIVGDVTAGAMIASTIVLGRALAPIDQLIGQWRTFLAARGSYKQLKNLAEEYPAETTRLQLPRPFKTLHANIRQAGPPLAQNATIAGISFDLNAGEVVAVIGPSGSGKSTLAKMLSGIWSPQRGEIKLDGNSMSKWDGEELGRLIGYLPQEVDLFDGTVRENIARFSTDIDDARVLEAAVTADVHELISNLPDGYETKIGNGFFLSGGQRQRIGLARALYNDPFVLILDEPNSNLDATGDLALRNAIEAAKHRGAVVVVMTHRPSTLQAVDKVLVLSDGMQREFGDKAEVLKANTRNVLDSNRKRNSVNESQNTQFKERAAQ